jgi:hypothetical protein
LFISPSGEPFRRGDGLAVWFVGADADQDGAVTLTEFRGDAARFFRDLDADGNGLIDGFEIQAYERDLVPEITHMGFDAGPPQADGSQQDERPRRGGGGGGRGRGRRDEGSTTGDGSMGGGARPASVGREGAARFSLLNEPEPVAGGDEDLNGRVTLEEWTHAATRRFRLLDHAGSGRLTLVALRPPPAKR